MTSSAENRNDASDENLPPRRGRPRRKVPSLDRGGVLQFPTRSNPKDWRHRHFERKNPLNWDFASLRPALGRAMLDAVHRMSGPGKAIATGSTALAYQTQSKPFFLWLAETEKDARGQEPGKEDTILDPQIVEDFRIAMDLRATLGEVTGTTAYAYKAAPLRILRQLYLEDAAVLGPGWRDEDFLPGERIDDTKPNAPYSLAESQRIISACAAILHRTHDSGDPGDRAAMEIAAFVIIGLKLGIEPECLPVLTLANLPDIVAQAVQMLQKLLAPYRAMHGSDLLMLSKDALRKPKSRDRKLQRSSKTGYPLSVTSIGSLVNLFYERARWQRDAIAQTDPSVNQAPDYHIKPSQFRRTLARFIARQPFGIIAGRLQYHHVSTAVFEGYAGSISDTFALDVEDERILAGIDILEEMRSDARAGWRAGPGASRVLAEWENVREVGLASAVVDTSSKGAVLDNSVRKLVQTVHVGSLSYCVFNVSNALCLTEQEKSSPGASPAISMCSPDKCANSVIAPCHVPKWQGLLDEVRRLTGTARSGPQKQSLRTAAERYEGVIAKAQGGGNGKD